MNKLVSATALTLAVLFGGSTLALAADAAAPAADAGAKKEQAAPAPAKKKHKKHKKHVAAAVKQDMAKPAEGAAPAK